MSVSVITGDSSTTTACALAATWPTTRDVVIVELDPSGGSLAGWFGLPPTPSLSTLAATARRTRSDQHSWTAVEPSVRRTAAGLSLLTAPVRATEARRAVEEVTARLLEAIAASPVDLVIDAGRTDPSHVDVIAGTADHIVLTHRQDVRSVGAASVRVERLAETAEHLAMHPRIALPEVEPEQPNNSLSSRSHIEARLIVAVIGDQPFPASEVIELVAARVDAPVAGAHLADDQLAAAVLAGRSGVSERRLRRLPLMRSAASLASRLAGPAAEATPPRLSATPVGSDAGATAPGDAMTTGHDILQLASAGRLAYEGDAVDD